MALEIPRTENSDLALPTLARRRATDEVYEVMRRSILTNAFLPGQRLPIEEIAKKLGVSLTPVRHAVQQLATEGLIEIRPRSGTFIARLDTRDIAETFDIRRSLECLAAETAVERITDEQLRLARRLVWALSEPVENEEERRRHEANNSAFHRVIIDSSGNTRLSELYEGLKAHLQIARVHSGESAGPLAARMQQEQAEHEEILKALEDRDCVRLVQALTSHINRAKNALISSLQEPANA
jgi:GntR family transcriptional regulator, rspAB operon transcriptional repressor